MAKPKTVVITGAASGVGRELALGWAARGANLALIDLLADPIHQLRVLTQTPENKVTTYTADVTHLDRMKEVAKQICSEFPSVDIVVACAGVGGINPAPHFSYELDRQIVEINYFGTVNTLIPFIPKLLEQKSGHLVGVCSLASTRGLPQASSYSASKAAQKNFLESLRIELKKNAIDVTTVLPGFVATPMANHKEFFMPFKTSAQTAAAKIIHAVEQKKTRVAFPWPMAFLSNLQKRLPDRIYDWLMTHTAGGPKATSPKLLSILSKNE